MESNLICNHTSDTVQWESESFITSTIKERVGRHEVLLLINYENYNFREKRNRQVMEKNCD